MRVGLSESSSLISEDLTLTSRYLLSRAYNLSKEREFFIDNLLVRIHLFIERMFSGPAVRHESLNFLSQVALYLSSSNLARHAESD